MRRSRASAGCSLPLMRLERASIQRVSTKARIATHNLVSCTHYAVSDESREVGSAELFPTDAPLRSDELIGRSADVSRVAQGLSGGENIVIVGARRTGKTSVGDAALAACARGGGYVVRVDLFELPDAATFAHELSLSVLANRPVLRRAIASAAGAPGRLIDALSAAATLRARHDLGEDVEITLSQGRADVTSARRAAGCICPAAAHRSGR